MWASVAPFLSARVPCAWWPLADRRGVTMLEYGLIAGLVALACVTAISGIAPNISAIFNTVGNSL